MPLQPLPRKKTYSPPKLSKLTPDQAKLTLIGHASCRDQGAKDLLDVLYPLSEAERNQNVCTDSKDENLAETKSRMSRLIRRALISFPILKRGFSPVHSRIGRITAEWLTLRMYGRSYPRIQDPGGGRFTSVSKAGRGTLAQKEYAVCVAKDGREASELLTEHRPALVITDWEMPDDITGIELCGQMRSDRSSYTYIILLTSNTDKDQIIKGLAAGADDYLTKSFHSGELVARVAVGRRIVELHREIQAKNRLLEELALTDSLTSLPNRRASEEGSTTALRRHAARLFLLGRDGRFGFI